MSPIQRLRAKSKQRLEALRLFTESYPCEGAERGWKGMLHEEGCPGVHHERQSRDVGEECECDGDYRATLVLRALR